MSNNRESTRIGLVIDIKVTFDDESEHILKSRNISDHGVFLEHNEGSLAFSVGQKVILQVCSQLGDEPLPPVKAEIARITNEGIGLQFIL
ncbi:MAG: PilZ domain-containing protein [Gammaproteobacteria bacterium]|nr:PilZ domain-containing protein [Gammaproteobacteria bacterium]